MGTVWKRFLSRLTARRLRARRVPIAERFAHFRAIGAANDAFLDNLTSLMEGRTRRSGGLAVVAAAYEALSAPVGALVRALSAMGCGRYQSLLHRYEAIDRELSQEVLKARPIEFGASVIWPDHPEAQRPQVVGPKAARLAEIGALGGFEVPPFFVVTVYGFRTFMEATGLQDLAEASLWSADAADGLGLKRLSGTMQEAAVAASVPAGLAAELLLAFRRLRQEHPALRGVAVRSSAVVEDSESSFAGQFESMLNVGEDGLLEAYKQVIASKYRLEALQYAMARGFLDEDVRMPVLVMAMVRPVAAGVAYSCDPSHPGRAVVTAVRGLAQPVVEGRVVPDRYLVTTAAPQRVVAMTAGDRSMVLGCQAGGGLVETPVDVRQRDEPALTAEDACRVALKAQNLERAFQVPQDVEWAIDDAGRLFIVQSRPLGAFHAAEEVTAVHPGAEGYRVLVRDAVRASGGVACGRILRLADVSMVEAAPDDAVLLVPYTSPRLAGMVSRVRAILATTGSPTGHMATVAREFRVPCLVGVDATLPGLEEGALVTVDGRSGTVYEGEVAELLSAASSSSPGARRDPVGEGLDRLLARVAPLTLTDPDSPGFQATRCRTLHDIARFVHQSAMAEMFELEGLSPGERRQAHRLAWHIPMDVLLLDLGGALSPGAPRLVPPDQVLSAPLRALLEGMTDPRLRWAGPVGFDFKGFVSVVVRSAADDQRYGEPSYALSSRDYLYFSSRLAYHFATVDAICGRSVNENYARFLFHGGAAVSARREFRAHFLASVLRANGFAVKMLGDRVEALLSKRPADAIEESLVMLGRLMVASRHLDMVMESRATADAFSQAFLSGDYGFELVRRG